MNKKPNQSNLLISDLFHATLEDNIEPSKLIYIFNYAVHGNGGHMCNIIEPYVRLAHYAETDQMGIIHHSNYIRWLEEARIHYLDKIGLSYEILEKTGIHCPVLTVSCKYRSPVKFHEQVKIQPTLNGFNGIRLTFTYEIRDMQTDQLRLEAETSHCFVDQGFKILNLKKDKPDVFTLLKLRWDNSKTK